MTRNKQTIKVVTVSVERRRRWSPAEKAALVRETYQPGSSVSLVARKHGMSASQLFACAHARFTQQQFQPHSHDSWSFFSVISGVKKIALPSAQPIFAHAGDIYLFLPEQAHAGCSVNADPCEYAMLHVSEQSWQRQCALRDVGSELGHVLPQRHPELSRRISAFVLGTPVQQSTQPRWDDLCDVFFSHDTS